MPINLLYFLDQVRGLSCILVFLYHGGFTDVNLNLGGFGVDIFFFLSAFLLTYGQYKTLLSISNREPVKQTLKALVKYFARRVMRVYPLFFILACVLKLGPSIWRDAYYMPPEIDLLKILVFADGHRHHVFWTLPVEFSYYLFIPVYVALIFITKRYWYILNTLFFVFGTYSSMVWHREAFMGLAAHIGTFITGSSFGILFYHLKETKITKLKRVLFEIIALASFVVICSQASKTFLFKTLNIPFNGTYPYISGFLGILFVKELIYAGPVTHFMDWSVFSFTGKVSFSMYLLHPIGLQYARGLKGNDPFLWFIVYTYSLSIVSYYAIEYPIDLLSRRICVWIDSWFTQKHKSKLEEV